MAWNNLALPTVIALAATLLATGCASVSVVNQSIYPQVQPARAPEKIFVRDFDTRGLTIKADPTIPGDEAGFASVSQELSYSIVKELRATLGEAWRLAPDARLPESGWLVTGRIESLDAGNRLMRVALGFGGGASSITTLTEVSNLGAAAAAPRPFLTFHTIGTSGRSPGLLSPPYTNPISLTTAASVASTAYGESKGGPTGDSRRTSRMIAAAISEYFGSRGFIPPSAVRKAKRTWTDSLDLPSQVRRD